MVLHTIAVICLLVLLVNGLRTILGVPPVALWFRCRTCPSCNGTGYVRKVDSGLATVTKNGETMEIQL